MRRLSDWLRGRLRGWLEVPTLDEAIDATRQLYVFWEHRMQERERTTNAMLTGREEALHKRMSEVERRFEDRLKERERLIERREADMERLVGETTLAVEKTITAIQEAKMNWKAVVEAQERDKEETD